MKFMRRPDLTPSTRINIALEAMHNMGNYGYITNLAMFYNVSRTFIYSLIYTAAIALYGQFNFLNLSRKSLLEQQFIDKMILLHRLEGNCSIESISNMHQYQNMYPASVGYISERLTAYGKQLSNTLNTDVPVLCIWLNDEIFASNTPIIVTVEPISLAILRIELAEKRDHITWNTHFKELQDNHFSPLGLVGDRGKGIVQACNETFNTISYQPDIFHDFMALSKIILVTLEKAAYKAIQYEYDRQSIIGSAVSDEIIAKRLASYEKACQQALEVIELYDQSHYLFGEIQQLLEFVDENGCFRQPQQVRQDILAALKLLESLDNEKLCSAVATLKAHLDEILLYMRKAQQVHKELSQMIGDEDLLKALCIAWASDHKLYQNPTAKQKAYLKDLRDFSLQYCQLIVPKRHKEMKEYVFKALDTIVRASSLIEAVNSLIRPYLNTCKGQITQEMLNLIMFYHNHRKFNHGKRKGKAPIELLTGQKLDKHWLDILLDKVGH